MKKDKIKKRFEQQSSGETVRIPAKSKYDRRRLEDRNIRVAAYCRVSTDSDDQYTSFEAQVKHYTESVGKHPNWELYKVYADEGISGTSTKKRDQYLQMMADARAGKFDMIITKTVSRFTRNTVDGLKAARELLHMSPPIGIFFEEDKFNTLMPNSEFILTIMLSLAQGESTKKSETMLTRYKWGYEREEFFCPTKFLLGYDTDEDGYMVIEPEGAKTVRAIFTMYLAGNSASDIARTMTELGRPTGKNNLVWSSSSVMSVIRNERYCGDVLAPKSRVVDVLEHIRAKNEGHEDFFYMQNHHEGIVSRDEYIRALIMSKGNRNSCYFNPSYEMRVIKEGLLSGFIPINCSFGGYDAGHYMGVCDAAPKPEIPRKAEVIHIEGCEIARAQEFGDYGVALTTISPKSFNFNKECTRLLPKTEYVELLVHPIERLLAIRKTTADNRNAILWETGAVSSAGFMPTLYELCGWCGHWKYRAEAVCLVKRSERVLIFNLSETETIVCEKPKKKVKAQPDKPNAEEPIVQPKRPPQTFKPASWLDNFGDTMTSSYFSCRQHHAAALSKWQTNAQAQPISGFENTVKLPTEDSVAAVLAALEVCSA